MLAIRRRRHRERKLNDRDRAADPLNGRTDEALDVLERVARMGFDYPAAKDDNLASLRESPRFAAIVERFAANMQPTGTPTVAFTLLHSGVIPEGLAWDTASQR